MFNPYGMSSRPISRDKAEMDLALAIKKATSQEETSPKQKHVRTCIVYTWDYKTSVPFWNGIKAQPVFADEVQCFKALITMHKVIRGGHPATLPESIQEKSFITSLNRNLGYDARGYGALIRSYTDFLGSKLQFHMVHPEFNGTFDYEEYTSLKQTSDPNEGYETISEMMALQDKIDEFQKQIFNSFRGTSTNECKIAALVPLVEESYAIYNFITSMLRAMHRRVGTVEALSPLRERYNSQHHALRRFYGEASNLRYLTSLITIPKLSVDPPSLYDNDALASQPPRPITPPDEPDEDFINQQLEIERELEMQRQRELELQRQRELELQAQKQREQDEWMRQQQMMMMQQQRQQELDDRERRFREMEAQLANAKAQWERDQRMIGQYDAKVKSLEGQLNQLQLNNRSQDEARDDMIRQLQEELALWKQKYEALAKLYAQLRKEHLDLLTKFKDVNQKAQMAIASQSEIDKLNNTLKAKNLEMADLIRERDRFRDELGRIKDSNDEALYRLRREIEDYKFKLDELSKSKGAETETLMKKFRDEQDELEALVRSRTRLADDLRKMCDELKSELEGLKRSKDEEVAILQAGMDQSIMALADMKNRLDEGESGLLQRMSNMEKDHAAQLDKILDTILQNCISKIDESIFELDSPTHLGNQTATPEYTLTIIEKVQSSCTDFAKSFQAYLTPGGDQSVAITTANQFAYMMQQMMHNAKGVTRLAEDDETIDELMSYVRKSAISAKAFFQNVQSKSLGLVESSQRPAVVIRESDNVHSNLSSVTKTTEKLVSKDVKDVTLAEDIADAVESAMLNAAKAIEEATSRLQSIINAPADPKFSTAELQVHSSILAACIALTNAISNLIRCATLSQQEIVAHGKGSGSKTAFYKKNNRWTEGLISAAKAIAFATSILVETADGVVKGTHDIEQLVVAANEVAAATAQLVAASRVKAIQGSKTQDKLEHAAKVVLDATKALVRAANEAAAKKRREKEEAIDFGKLSIHELKTQEMEQQVKILKLEKDLVDARSRLADMRKTSYHS
ncbi:ANTH domain-containing protein [Paraphysoderma sedebokerense]|nr:ANTH domain-containing protein [Paraphysoderma sedebokerense]